MLSAMRASDADAVRRLMVNHLVDGFENVKHFISKKKSN